MMNRDGPMVSCIHFRDVNAWIATIPRTGTGRQGNSGSSGRMPQGVCGSAGISACAPASTLKNASPSRRTAASNSRRSMSFCGSKPSTMRWAAIWSAHSDRFRSRSPGSVAPTGEPLLTARSQDGSGQ